MSNDRKSRSLDMDLNWRDLTWVAFDTETTGAYPLGAEICEIAAVKWRGGEIVDRFQTLVKPKDSMGDFVIGIHGITNEMVATAPTFKEIAKSFTDFLAGAVGLGHHCQFDLGFIAAQLEDADLPLPNVPVLCTSLLAQAQITGTENHKLQTLTKHFNVDSGSAHRALDDSISCLQVAFHVFERIEKSLPLGEVLSAQKLGSLMKTRSEWRPELFQFKDFSVNDLERKAHLKAFIQAARHKEKVELTYGGGRAPGKARIVQPLGLIRQAEGDSFVALDLDDRSQKPKKFWVRDVIQTQRIQH